MKQMRLFMILILLVALAVPAQAAEITPPQVPESGARMMPEDTGSFSEGFRQLLEKGIKSLRPELTAATRVSMAVIAAVMILCLLHTFTGKVKAVADLAGCVSIAGILLQTADSMIALGAQTVRQLSEYGKLLCPVMTAALAAQGGTTASAALYAGTAAFDTILSGLIANLLVPLVYLFLALAVAAGAVGEDVLKKMRDLVKSAVSWCLKTLLMIFTTYMGITGVVSGATDAVTLKATKVTISSVVPVVGGILSDASEAVLVSVGLAKNAAGIYGILAVLAMFLEPFLKIGTQYLTLRVTAAICGIFGTKSAVDLIEDFSSGMGLLLAMTGSACLLLLISTVCFMKGVG